MGFAKKAQQISRSIRRWNEQRKARAVRCINDHQPIVVTAPPSSKNG